MCGRLNVIEDPLCQQVTEQLGLNFHVPSNEDLKPTQHVGVVGVNQGSLCQIDTTWGIKLAWSKRLLINAKAETVDSKPTFKKSFAYHRCVVPCSGWFEWKQREGDQRKTKYLFQQAQNQPLYMAGIYYLRQSEPAQLVTLTTAPNEQCADYHHRMPLLIQPEQVQYWLQSSSHEVKPILEQPMNWTELTINP